MTPLNQAIIRSEGSEKMTEVFLVKRMNLATGHMPEVLIEAETQKEAIEIFLGFPEIRNLFTHKPSIYAGVANEWDLRRAPHLISFLYELRRQAREQQA